MEFKNNSDTSNNRATGTISTSFRKCLSNMPEAHGIKEVQRTVILGTINTLQKYQGRSKRHSTWEMALHELNMYLQYICKTMYPRNMFFFSGM